MFKKIVATIALLGTFGLFAQSAHAETYSGTNREACESNGGTYQEGTCDLEMNDVTAESDFSDHFVSIPELIEPPRMPCIEGRTMWTVRPWNMLVTMEFCSPGNVNSPTNWTLFMNPVNAVNNCATMGGKYEFIGEPGGFNLNVCWDIDY